jgi:tRNA nucleotidyltransferase (CCA-adding enzyme)
MGIPQSQLEIWAKQGATVTAKSTHESIRNALAHERSLIKDRIGSSVKIYLQGSYKNDTNIRADSDVDVVVELTTTFGHNAHELPFDQKNAPENR